MRVRGAVCQRARLKDTERLGECKAKVLLPRWNVREVYAFAVSSSSCSQAGSSRYGRKQARQRAS
jgi:hypothetical protein